MDLDDDFTNLVGRQIISRGTFLMLVKIVVLAEIQPYIFEIENNLDNYHQLYKSHY